MVVGQAGRAAPLVAASGMPEDRLASFVAVEWKIVQAREPFRRYGRWHSYILIRSSTCFVGPINKPTLPIP